MKDEYRIYGHILRGRPMYISLVDDFQINSLLLQQRYKIVIILLRP